MATFVPEMRLFDDQGQRLYLTADERKRFLYAADNDSPENIMFCKVLHYTGCRPSEALELSPSRILLDEKAIVIRTLKKRKYDSQGRERRPQFRKVPVPDRLIKELRLVFNLNRKFQKKEWIEPFWSMSRTTAWRVINQVMDKAGITGPQATGKGLRHAFGIAMIEGGAPITLVRDLLGHADTKTTEIYLQVVGEEKRDMVLNAWG